MCLHPCVSLINEKICYEISEHRIAVCEKTTGTRSGNSSDLNSAYLKVSGHHKTVALVFVTAKETFQ